MKHIKRLIYVVFLFSFFCIMYKFIVRINSFCEEIYCRSISESENESPLLARDEIRGIQNKNTEQVFLKDNQHMRIKYRILLLAAVLVIGGIWKFYFGATYISKKNIFRNRYMEAAVWVRRGPPDCIDNFRLIMN